ncbi:hypothetical protein GCM10008090_28540 [Arenicella chitinivorans]|uniref:Right handed beta helix domain-containing protein n=1 Tax=Arenicella chitinivorans TaxID=1329800 RepID=A0A918S000_9GAMM|nr:right-handed parallel beta-helix repeat-containing protein [Arenicella chitinivorans]GHA17151.1 hypothetical protein GCM10008090_28540 [Arenicella chitinivorans]
MAAYFKQFLSSLFLLSLSFQSLAATIVVNTDITGDGCTIVDAINSANADTAMSGCLGTSTGSFGDDTIVIPEILAIQNLFMVNNTAGTLGANGLPQITSNITIEGNNALIRRSSSPSVPDFRLFYVGAGGNLVLKNVRLVNGKQSNGSAVFVYGGHARIEDSEVRQNNATDPNGCTIANNGVGTFDASVELVNTRVTNNTGCGVVSSSSGAITGSVQLVVQDSVVSGNSRTGISVATGTARIDRSEVSHNVGSGVRSGNDVTLLMRDSTISNNKSASSTSTGGGVAIVIGTGSPVTTLINNTISENEAGTGGGIRHSLGTLNLVNNIVSGNTSLVSSANGKEILRQAGFSGGTPIAGNQRNNLIGTSAITTAQAVSGFVPHASDLLATSNGTVPTPLRKIVRGLKNNGGSGRSHAPAGGSPAIDAAVSTYILGAIFLFGEGCAFTTFFPSFATVTRSDQRGVQRPQGAACDIGAVEYEETTLFVIPLASGGTVIVDL